MKEFEEIFKEVQSYERISPIFLMRKYKLDWDNAKRICEMIWCVRENSLSHIEGLKAR